ncbi:pentatricopeptide repeat-containing protein At1g11710, mitochondrial isoform X2 [Salvia hispanica]|uniref:pentatricopeptide repeat-containing protein At1g11710, mitochondrial isoform X2 n=1 Tax=Salvia hispanica TaxID=49212 RepID=UPI0020091C2A|nr:pentatricopeptide repeat-containing protein At1g11710, mitochondrial isoform X2 [Salvia hispanica]
MLFTLFKSKGRSVLVRGLHFCKKFTPPGAEDIIFKAICVNISQKKWKFLDQVSSSLTTTLLTRIFQELRSSPCLLLEFYQQVGGVDTVSCSLESCCILIHVMVERKNFDDALCLMKELMISKGYSPLEVLEALIHSSAGVSPSRAVSDALVRACTQIGATQDAYEVIKKSRIGGIRVSIHAWNNFLGHLLKIGDVAGFWEMYRKMVSYEYYESVNTYNLLIYALCKEGHLSEALSVFYRMIKAGVLPNVVGFNMLIDGASRADDLDVAQKVIENIGKMSRGCVSANVVTYNSLVNGYCKQVIDGYSRKGCLEEGYRLCDRMVENSMIPDAVVYTSLIHWLWMEGDISGVSLLLSNMMENRVDPDEVTHSMMINGLCRNGHVNEALKVQNWIIDMNLVEDAFSHSILMNYLCRSNDISGAEQLLCRMFVRGFLPDTVTYSAMIDGYCKASKMESAIEAYTDMVKVYKPNLVILNSILNGFCNEESMDISMSLLDEMKALNMFDTISFNTLLSSHCRTGRLKEAFDLFTSMRRMGFLVNTVTYNIMINCLCRFGLFDHAGQILSLMLHQGLTPDSITYTTLLTNLSNKSSFDEVVKMHDYLLLHGVHTDKATYEAIVRHDSS